MSEGLSFFDLAVIAAAVICCSAVAGYLGWRFACDHCDRELEGLRLEIQALTQRLGGIERRPPEQRALFAADPAPTEGTICGTPRAPRDGGEWPDATRDRGPPPGQITRPEPRRSLESLTRDAGAALASLDAFRSFARANGGTGYAVGAQTLEPVPGPDPILGAEIWAVELDRDVLFFPGFGLRRGQSGLLADAGRMARDKFGWLFDIEPGDELVARRPAIRGPAGPLEKGLLTLPL